MPYPSGHIKYSLIITAWNEPKTVKKNLENILDPDSRNLPENMEIILVCPDEDTYLAAYDVISRNGFKEFRYIKDERKGKPIALNMGINASKGDILVVMDGDVFVDQSSITKLVNFFRDGSVGGVSGRPVPVDSDDTMLGFWANLLTEAAHIVRSTETSKGRGYFMSGYLCAFRKLPEIILPDDVLCDDAWITLKILEKNLKIAYSPDSIVYVSFPKTISDWFKQKRRSAGGYLQLRQYYRDNPNFPRRNILKELGFLFFPFIYAKNLRHYLYAFILYPLRLVLWMIIFWDSLNGNWKNLWVRIESTK